jgi:peptide/nickel transport system substrate-binding protein
VSDSGRIFLKRVFVALLPLGLVGALVFLFTSEGSNPEPASKNSLVTTARVAHLDPGQFDEGDYFFHAAVHRWLYSYKPSSKTPVADLAKGMPVVSDDGLTVTVQLKTNVRFSPPVDRIVTAKDVKFAIERTFRGSLATGSTLGSDFFSAIVGAPKTLTEKHPSITGITTPTPHTLQINLTRPARGNIAKHLADPVTAPVPSEYATKFDDEQRSQYLSHVVFTGPYMVKTDKEGDLVGHKPTVSVHLVRNPSWDRKTDYRPAYLDEIILKDRSSPQEGDHQSNEKLQIAQNQHYGGLDLAHSYLRGYGN